MDVFSVALRGLISGSKWNVIKNIFNRDKYAKATLSSRYEQAYWINDSKANVKPSEYSGFRYIIRIIDEPVLPVSLNGDEYISKKILEIIRRNNKKYNFANKVDKRFIIKESVLREKKDFINPPGSTGYNPSCVNVSKGSAL